MNPSIKKQTSHNQTPMQKYFYAGSGELIWKQVPLRHVAKGATGLLGDGIQTWGGIYEDLYYTSDFGQEGAYGFHFLESCNNSNGMKFRNVGASLQKVGFAVDASMWCCDIDGIFLDAITDSCIRFTPKAGGPANSIRNLNITGSHWATPTRLINVNENSTEPRILLVAQGGFVGSNWNIQGIDVSAAIIATASSSLIIDSLRYEHLKLRHDKNGEPIALHDVQYYMKVGMMNIACATNESGPKMRLFNQHVPSSVDKNGKNSHDLLEIDCVFKVDDGVRFDMTKINGVNQFEDKRMYIHNFIDVGRNSGPNGTDLTCTNGHFSSRYQSA